MSPFTILQTGFYWPLPKKSVLVLTAAEPCVPFWNVKHSTQKASRQRSCGTAVFCLSGAVAQTRNYELVTLPTLPVFSILPLVCPDDHISRLFYDRFSLLISAHSYFGSLIQFLATVGFVSGFFFLKRKGSAGRSLLLFFQVFALARSTLLCGTVSVHISRFFYPNFVKATLRTLFPVLIAIVGG